MVKKNNLNESRKEKNVSKIKKRTEKYTYKGMNLVLPALSSNISYDIAQKAAQDINTFVCEIPINERISIELARKFRLWLETYKAYHKFQPVKFIYNIIEKGKVERILTIYDVYTLELYTKIYTIN